MPFYICVLGDSDAELDVRFIPAPLDRDINQLIWAGPYRTREEADFIALAAWQWFGIIRRRVGF